MNRISELDTLKARTSALEKRLALFERRLQALPQRGPGISRLKAVIDPDRCVHCGRCEAVCPVGAIIVNGEVRVDANRCQGCGTCAAECPERAISLRPTGVAPLRSPPSPTPGAEAMGPG